MQGSKLLNHLRLKNKLRLIISKSNKNIYMQVIDDNSSCTIFSASTIQVSILETFSDSRKEINRSNVSWGKRIAEYSVKPLLQLLEKNFANTYIVFDRRGNKFSLLNQEMINILKEGGINIGGLKV